MQYRTEVFLERMAANWSKLALPTDSVDLRGELSQDRNCGARSRKMPANLALIGQTGTIL